MRLKGPYLGGRNKRRVKRVPADSELAGPIRITDFYTGKGRKVVKDNNLTKKERGK